MAPFGFVCAIRGSAVDLGLGLFVLGTTIVSTFTIEEDLSMSPGVTDEVISLYVATGIERALIGKIVGVEASTDAIVRAINWAIFTFPLSWK